MRLVYPTFSAHLDELSSLGDLFDKYLSQDDLDLEAMQELMAQEIARDIIINGENPSRTEYFDSDLIQFSGRKVAPATQIYEEALKSYHHKDLLHPRNFHRNPKKLIDFTMNELMNNRIEVISSCGDTFEQLTSQVEPIQVADESMKTDNTIDQSIANGCYKETESLTERAKGSEKPQLLSFQRNLQREKDI